MPRWSTLSIASALVSLALTASPCLAAKKNSNPAPRNVDQSSTLEIGRLSQAYALASWAETNKNAIAYAVAGSMLSEISIGPSRMKLRGTAVLAPANMTPRALSSEQMIAKARELSAGNASTLAAVNEIAAKASDISKGSIQGPGCWDGYIDGDNDVIFDDAFAANRPAVVTLVGWSSDIDLWVYDENGNLICRSTSYGASERCDFYPNWTGTFALKVENHNHPNGTDFRLCTN